MSTLFLPHQHSPYPSDTFECLPVQAIRHVYRGTSFHGKREEIISDHINMIGSLFFRKRHEGFLICLN